jgi:hypothetical protein
VVFVAADKSKKGQVRIRRLADRTDRVLPLADLAAELPGKKP